MTDIKAIENFLYDEADLLDCANLDAWIELYTEDGTYWMPTLVDQADPLNHISLVYDDRVLMEIRRRNFVHPRAASKDHPVRCSHIIGNVRLKGKTESGDLIVTSNFQALMNYRNEQRVYGGTYEHHLATNGDSYLIRHKKVVLINCDAPQKTTVIYL